jgi:hypothetical protein
VWKLSRKRGKEKKVPRRGEDFTKKDFFRLPRRREDLVESTVLYPGEEKTSLKKISFVYPEEEKILLEAQSCTQERRRPHWKEKISFVYPEEEKILLEAQSCTQERRRLHWKDFFCLPRKGERSCWRHNLVPRRGKDFEKKKTWACTRGKRKETLSMIKEHKTNAQKKEKGKLVTIARSNDWKLQRKRMIKATTIQERHLKITV